MTGPIYGITVTSAMVQVADTVEDSSVFGDRCSRRTISSIGQAKDVLTSAATRGAAILDEEEKALISRAIDVIDALRQKLFARGFHVANLQEYNRRRILVANRQERKRRSRAVTIKQK